MMPVGDGVVLVGMGERTTARAVSILATNMFAEGAARLVIGAQMPRERAAMHLDTVFTFCDRNVVTLYEPVVSQIRPILFRPDGDGGVQAEVSERSFLDEVKDALGHHGPEARARPAATSSRPSATSGTTATTSSRSSRAWSSPTSATRPPTRSSTKAGIEVLAIAGPGARPRARRRPLHDLPDRPRRLRRSTR